MQITLNGSSHELPEGASLRTLIEDLGLGNAAVAAEVNGAVVPKRDHQDRRLVEGDTVELVTLVGGG